MESIIGTAAYWYGEYWELDNQENKFWAAGRIGQGAEEIKDALFSIKDGKAPGPDGFNACFFKKAWGVIGGSVVQAIKSFFSSLLKELNTTAVSLIPKVVNPSQLNDFRPCCNTIYKCITKILARRMKSVMRWGINKQPSLKDGELGTTYFWPRNFFITITVIGVPRDAPSRLTWWKPMTRLDGTFF